MTLMSDMVHVILLAIQVLQSAWVVVFGLLWCFMRAQNCSNVRPGGRGQTEVFL